MISSLLSLLSLTGITGPSPAPAYHAVAFITDPLSHGAVGDGLLSLNEAIQLHNGTLLITQMSAAEQLQLSLLPGTGNTSDITWIEIDTEVTGIITIEQDLETITNTPFGLFIRGSGGVATLDFSGAGITRGIHAVSNNLILQDLHIVGGPYGVEVDQSDATGQPGCTLEGVIFENLSQFGLRVTGTQQNAIGRLIVEQCEFRNTPTAIAFDESVANRTTIFESRNVEITGADVGFELSIGTGGSARFAFDRAIVEATSIGIDLDAPSTLGRPTLIEGNHARIRAPICASFDGATDAVTWMQCTMWNLLAFPGGTALQLGNLGHQVYGDMQEFRCVGDVTIATGNGPQPLIVRNMRSKDGSVTLSTSASQQLTVTESRFVNCTTESTGTGPTSFDGCSFEGGIVGGTSAAGLIDATDCYINNAGAGLTANQARSMPHLGSMEVWPDDGFIGNAIQFHADLPAGLLCGFALGIATPTPQLLPSPFYVYFDLTQYVLLPGVYLGQQSTSWFVPNLPQIVGYELVVQATVLPLTNLQAPDLQLPPGWRFVLR